MARETVSVVEVVQTGVAVVWHSTTTAAPWSDGLAFANPEGQRTLVYIYNGSGGDTTFTFKTTKTVYGLTVPDEIITVPNLAERWVGPFPQDLFNQTDGTVHLDIADSTAAEFAVMHTATV